MEDYYIFQVKQKSLHPKKIQWAGLGTWGNMHLLITEKRLVLETMTRGDHAITTLCFYPPPKLFGIRVFHNGMGLGLLYIWFDHYARKDAGWRLFDHKKDTVVASCFCWPFSLFVTFVTFFTACNFCKLFFIVEGSLFVTFLLIVTFINYFLLLRGARGIVLLYLFIVQGEGVRLDFIF